MKNVVFWDINPVRTSQETHYVSAIRPTLLMICKILGIHGGDYEECRLLGCDTVWLLLRTVYRSSPILVTLMMLIHFSETSVLIRGTRRSIPEDGILGRSGSGYDRWRPPLNSVINRVVA
jgi:hypothetical protein